MPITSIECIGIQVNKVVIFMNYVVGEFPRILSYGFQFLVRRRTIGKPLRCFNCVATPLIHQQVPNPATARHDE
jgi:hypothetical protein